MNISKLGLAAGIILAGTSVSWAGGIAPAISQPPLAAPAPVAAGAPATGAQPFSGFYGGLSFSSIESRFNKNCEPTFVLGCQDIPGRTSNGVGLRLGWDARFGNFALGALVDYDHYGEASGGAKSFAAAKIRLGYVFDQKSMIYGAAGIAHANFTEPGVNSMLPNLVYTIKQEAAPVLSIGYERILGERTSLFGEFSYAKFDDVMKGEIGGAPPTLLLKSDIEVRQLKFGINVRF